MVEPPWRALVIGDATLDIIARPAAPPRTGADRPAVISLGPGGQGANVAVRLGRRGWAVRLLAAVGTDLPGTLLGGGLDAAGIEVRGPTDQPSSTVVALIDGSGDRAMLSDRSGLPVDAVAESVLRELVDGVRWIHLSGYVLADGASGDALARAVAATAGAIPVSVGGGSFYGADVTGRWLKVRPRLSVFDRAEAEALLPGGGGGVADLARSLADLSGSLVVVTDGAAGAVAALPDGTVATTPTPHATEARDATGAGDAFTAVLIDTLAAEPWPPQADRLTRALGAAAIVGAQVAAVVGAQTPVPGEEMSTR